MKKRYFVLWYSKEADNYILELVNYDYKLQFNTLEDFKDYFNKHGNT